MLSSFTSGIEDIAEQFGLEENLGVVAMGGRSTVVQELTNDFGLVRDAIGIWLYLVISRFSV